MEGIHADTSGRRRAVARPDPAQAHDSEPDPGLVKVSLNLSQDLFKSVVAVAERRRITKTEVIRRALSMEIYFEEVREAEKGQLELFVRRQGIVQQVVFPWLQ
jgi:hypothetical protein